MYKADQLILWEGQGSRYLDEEEKKMLQFPFLKVQFIVVYFSPSMEIQSRKQHTFSYTNDVAKQLIFTHHDNIHSH